MRVIVTGATGFLGRHLVKRLSEHPDIFTDITTMSKSPIFSGCSPYSHRHYTCDLSFSDSESPTFNMFRGICRQHNPDIIFHLAGNAVPKLNEKDPHKIINDNVIGTHKVVHFCPENCKVILASSVIVYGDWLFSLDEEGSYTESHATHPVSVYGVSKLASEKLLRSYISMGKCRGSILRLCATIGSGVTHGVIKDFIRKINSNTDTLEVLGSHPGSTKPYCYISDAVEAFIRVALDKREDQIYNVVPDNSISIEQVAQTVIDTMDVERDIKWLGEGSNWKGDNRIIRASNDKLKSIGWEPKYKNSSRSVAQAVLDMLT